MIGAPKGHCGLQTSVERLLRQPSTSSGRTDTNGAPLDVVAILEWSFRQLPSPNHQ